MTKNAGPKPRTGAQGQSQKCDHGKGGYNQPAKPFGVPNGKTAKPGKPAQGTQGQRLAGGASAGNATGYPPGYNSR